MCYGKREKKQIEYDTRSVNGDFRLYENDNNNITHDMINNIIRCAIQNLEIFSREHKVNYEKKKKKLY